MNRANARPITVHPPTIATVVVGIPAIVAGTAGTADALLGEDRQAAGFKIHDT